MSMGKCPSARLGGLGLAHDVGPSPKNLGIAQFYLCFSASISHLEKGDVPSFLSPQAHGDVQSVID